MFSIRVVEMCQIYGYIHIIYRYVYKRGYMSVEKVYLQKCFDRQIKGHHTAIISHSLFDARTSMYSSSSFLNLQYCAKILRGPRTINQYFLHSNIFLKCIFYMHEIFCKINIINRALFFFIEKSHCKIISRILL